MGDSVSNQGEITPKGVDGSIQLAAGGDLKAVDGVTVSDAGQLTAVMFVGDGGLLSNVSGGGGGVGTLQEVTEQGNTTSNTIEFTNVTTGLVVSSNITVAGNVTADFFVGEGSNVTNTVDVAQGTYGDNSTVAAITVSSDGRITGISDVSISFPAETQTLQDVTERANDTTEGLSVTSSNILVTTGNVTADFFVGEGSNVTNTVDQEDGTYGDGSNVSTITVSGGRITTISNTTIIEHTLSNVVNTGNTTSNTVEFTNVTTGISVTSNIANEKLIGDSIIITTSTGNVLTTSEYLTYTSNILSVDGGQGGIVTRRLEYINKFNTVSGVNVLSGQPCYITNQGGSGEVESNLALNTTSDYMPSIGLALTDYNRNDSGYIVRSGRVFDIADSVFESNPISGDRGKAVYVSSTSGKLTFDRPTGNTHLIQNVGILLTAATDQNTILVQGPGRANDTPNFVDCNQANVKYNLSITDGSLVESTNLYVTGNVYVDNVNANAIVTNGNMVCSNIYGNGQGLSNTINNLISGGTYGDNSTVAAITVSSDGRIDSITDVSISFPVETQNLQDVTHRGNVTSNTIEFTNVTTGLVVSSNITVAGNVTADFFVGEGSNVTNTVDSSNIASGVYGAGGSNVAVIVVSSDGRINGISNTTISGGGGGPSSGTATHDSGTGAVSIDLDSGTNKYFTLEPTASIISSITVNNGADGAMGIVDIRPRTSADIDIFQSVSSGTIKTTTYSNTVINSLSHCIITLSYIDSNTFISFSEYK